MYIGNWLYFIANISSFSFIVSSQMIVDHLKFFTAPFEIICLFFFFCSFFSNFKAKARRILRKPCRAATTWVIIRAYFKSDCSLKRQRGIHSYLDLYTGLKRKKTTSILGLIVANKNSQIPLLNSLFIDAVAFCTL